MRFFLLANLATIIGKLRTYLSNPKQAFTTQEWVSAFGRKQPIVWASQNRHSGGLRGTTPWI